MDAAEHLDDLRHPPGNRLEQLSGDRRGQYSTRINQQWRACFRWSNGKSSDVESATTNDDGETWHLKNPTAGDILLEEFLQPLGMSQTALAKAIGVPPRRINEIVLGKRGVTTDTDLRLCRYWGMSEGFFLRLQDSYDLMEAKRKLGGELDKIVPRAA